MKKNKNVIWNPDNRSGADKWIELIRDMGGTIFVDPCPTQHNRFSIWKRFFHKK